MTPDSAGQPDPRVVDEVSEDDRCWFEAHPGRHYRIRRGVEGEVSIPVRWMVVVQLAPGMRLRVGSTLDDASAAIMAASGRIELIAGMPTWFPAPEANVN